MKIQMYNNTQFQTTEQEIAEFFEPVCPVHISLIYSRNGRPSGEAEVSVLWGRGGLVDGFRVEGCSVAVGSRGVHLTALGSRGVHVS